MIEQYSGRCWPWSHKWNKWEPYLWEGYTYGDISMMYPFERTKIAVTFDRQKRQCVRCGLSQDKRVRP